jgi:hypothetical protein
MIAKLHRSRKDEGLLWYHNDDLGVRHTFFASIMSIQDDKITGVMIVFLVFNLTVAWKRKNGKQ